MCGGVGELLGVNAAEHAVEERGFAYELTRRDAACWSERAKSHGGRTNRPRLRGCCVGAFIHSCSLDVRGRVKAPPLSYCA